MSVVTMQASAWAFDPSLKRCLASTNIVKERSLSRKHHSESYLQDFEADMRRLLAPVEEEMRQSFQESAESLPVQVDAEVHAAP